MTIWWCERCHASGCEDFAGVDVHTAVHRLDEAHQGHALAKIQHCDASVRLLRVQEQESLTSQPRA